MGAYADHGAGLKKAGPPIRATVDYANKLRASLDEAIDACKIKNGMTISFHHHLRDGDSRERGRRQLAARGLKDLVFAPSALFPVHEPLVGHIERGVIWRIEGSMNGPIGRACSIGRIKRVCFFARTAGGPARFRTATFMSTSPLSRRRRRTPSVTRTDFGALCLRAARLRGRRRALRGPVVVVTDNLVPFPLHAVGIRGGNVDHVCVVEKLGDPEKIVSGTTKITRSPTRQLIAKLAAEFVRAAGLLDEPDFSFQAGAGGVSLAFVQYLAEIMRAKKVTAAFARGGSNELLCGLLREGIIECVLDGQAFDTAGVTRSGKTRSTSRPTPSRPTTII